MDKALCCTPSGADVPALKALWQTVFGDTPGFIHRFFDRWYAPALTAVVKTGGAVAAMAYVLPTGRYLTPASAIPAAMIYAVACDPRHRGRGFGFNVDVFRSCTDGFHKPFFGYLGGRPAFFGRQGLA